MMDLISQGIKSIEKKFYKMPAGLNFHSATTDTGTFAPLQILLLLNIINHHQLTLLP